MTFPHPASDQLRVLGALLDDENFLGVGGRDPSGDRLRVEVWLRRHKSDYRGA